MVGFVRYRGGIDGVILSPVGGRAGRRAEATKDMFDLELE